MPFEKPQPKWRLVTATACVHPDGRHIIVLWTWKAEGEDVPELSPGSEPAGAPS
ncbi:MAG TPA: hypothetical protein VH062_35665 [Polyangiaceae bacterium]|jgi:hypothetical protein|nr:hypothetical protein [Polyangiaceae bacterium]